MKRLLALAALGEGVTGMILLVHPQIVVSLLFGAQVAGAGSVMSRIAGMGLIALGLACWPGRDLGNGTGALRAMLVYSLLATLYLAYLGVGGEWTGVLLWPAVAVHALLSVLLARAWQAQRSKGW